MFGRAAPREADAFRSGPAPSAHPDQPEEDTLALRLRAALDAIGEAIFICDGAGNTIFENQAAVQLKAVRPGNALVDQAVHDAIGQALSGHRPEGNLELIAAPNRRTLSVRAVPISGPAGPDGALAVVEDISERLRLEAVRRDFVANVSHELKTPVGALALLAETLDGETSPEVVARLARRLGHEAERLSAIIDDLLDLSRIEANEAPDRKVVSVRDLVDEAVNRLRTAATGLEVTVEVEPVAPGLSLYGDHRDLVSAVANLVDNALKYSEPGGTVSVRATPRERNIDISVKDHGVGIPARDLERIFERFYRVDRARSRSTGGTGLGLSIVRNVAANHNGSVSVHSVEGEGSTFTLSLPRLEDQR
jgi:two-component system sensor histidine kinase SenX3